MAGEAGNIHVLVMPADTALVDMADQAFIIRWLELAMGFVAALAFQGTHDALGRDVAMAGEAFLSLRHDGRFAIHMAAQAGETFHAHAVDPIVFMALETFLFVRGKIMLLPGMAFLAGNFFHEDMPGMAIGFSHGHPPLPCRLQVADATACPWFFAAMLMLDAAFVSAHDIRQQKFVLAEHIH